TDAEKKENIGAGKVTGKKAGNGNSLITVRPGNAHLRGKLGNMQDKAGASLKGLFYAPALLLQKAGNGNWVLPALTVEKQMMRSTIPLNNDNDKAQQEPATKEEVKPPAAKNHYFYIQALVSPDI